MSHDLRRRPQTNSNTNSALLADKDSVSVNPQQNGLLPWARLPQWAKDNEYIHSGYRQISYSYLESFRSCFYIHNETGNIYSHLLAMLWMIMLPIIFYPYAKEHYPNASGDDWAVFGLYFLGGALCFGLSTAYHAFSNHSHEVHDFYHRLDLLGISAVTAGCFPPGMWYTFPCADRSIKIFWISLDLVAQVTAAIVVLFVRRFRRPAWRPFRGFLFSFMASSAFYPIIYACFQHGYRQMDVEAGATRYAWTVVVYLTAVTMYGTRIPEAWKPGYYDLWGQSHQIFHVLMAVGLTVHFSAFAKAFDYTHSTKQC